MDERRSRLRFLATAFLLSAVFFSGESFCQTATLQATMALRTVDGLSIPHQNGMPVPSFEKQKRSTVSLNGLWRKQRFSASDNATLAKRDAAGYANLVAEAAGRFLPGYADGSWQQATVPRVENTMKGYEVTPEYYEDGVWYRYSFSLSDSLKEKFAKLIFYAVNYVADVWLNGHYVGYHEGGYTSFAFNVTPFLRFDSANVVVVRVDNPSWNSGRNDIVPYSMVDWFNYTGIMHDVYLEFSAPLSTMRVDLVPKDLNGSVQATVTLFNAGNTVENTDVALEVYRASIDSLNIRSEKASDLLGNPVSLSGPVQTNLSLQPDSARAWRTNIVIQNPRLWSPRNPNLYVLRVILSQGGKTVDEFYTQFGIRTVRAANSRCLLNDKATFFTGVARHEDHPVYGRSIPQEIIYSDLQTIKKLNVSFLRTGHYPNNPYTYLIADRLGLTVMEEIPLWQFDTPDPWLIQNNTRRIHQQMWREMIFRDYNRPSIILWSACNECLDVDNRKIFIQTVHDDLDQMYPDGRLVAQSAAADRPGPNDASQAACDVAGWTLYFGIFYGTPKDYTASTTNFLIRGFGANPGRPILDTEFGYWSTEDGSSQSVQVTVFNETFKSFSNWAANDSSGNPIGTGFLMASTWWCAYDWYSSGHPAGFQSMGLYHMDRATEKPVAAALRSTYEPYYRNGLPVTGVRAFSEPVTPKEFRLEQNYPNPFNPITVISYSVPPMAGRDLVSTGGQDEQLPVASDVRLAVYDILGREVATLVNDVKQPGAYTVSWDASGKASGVYFYRLFARHRAGGPAGNFVATKKLLLVR